MDIKIWLISSDYRYVIGSIVDTKFLYIKKCHKIKRNILPWKQRVPQTGCHLSLAPCSFCYGMQQLSGASCLLQVVALELLLVSLSSSSSPPFFFLHAWSALTVTNYGWLGNCIRRNMTHKNNVWPYRAGRCTLQVCQMAGLNLMIHLQQKNIF